MLSFSKKNNTILTFVFLIAFYAIYTLYKLFFFQADNYNADYINPAESLFGLNIPKDIHFCGERVPQNDFSIKENLDKEFLGNSEKSSAFVLFKRAAFWFAPIEAVLVRNNIPLDIKYVAVAESRLTNSQSSQGAAGFWQFVPSTGASCGLEINDEVDERYSVEKSTEAACKIFKDAYKHFGSWTLAAAAYNLGMGGIEAQLKKQKSRDYYGLMLNKETAQYMYRILALKTLFENSSKHKISGTKSFYGIPLLTFKVDTTIANLTVFAANLGYTYNVLKVFNPWLRKNKLSNPSKKTYLIKFPKKEYLKNGFSYFGIDLVHEDFDSTLIQKETKLDSIIQKVDSEMEVKNIEASPKKDIDKNEEQR